MIFGSSVHNINLSCEVRLDFQVIQGGHSSCFQQVAAVLFFSCSSGQFLPQQGGAIQFWMLPSIPEINSGIHLRPSTLCLSQSLQDARSSSRQLVCQPCPCSQLLMFYGVSLRVWCWHLGSLPTLDSSAVRNQLFAPPLFSRVGSEFHLHCWCSC
jgi:hypothetical protein